jgi:hypothetical protein
LRVEDIGFEINSCGRGCDPAAVCVNAVMNRTLSYKEGNVLGTLWTIRFSRRNLSVNMILATETSTCCN